MEFGASEGELMVSLWMDASCPLDLEVLPFHPPHKMAKNLKCPKFQKSQTSPNCCAVEVWDVSCRYAQTAAALGVLLFRPKIV